MPGPAFNLEVLDLARAKLGGTPAGQDLDAHPEYGRLGALGPDLLRFNQIDISAVNLIISTPDLSTLSPAQLLDLASKVYVNPPMALWAAVLKVLKPQLQNFRDIDDFLSRLKKIADDEDKDALLDIIDEFNGIKPKIDALGTIKDSVNALMAAGLAAVVLSEPKFENGNLDTTKYRPHELLRWARTGTFAQKLIQKAKARNDPKLRAFAYGYLSHVATSITAEPFVNSITGGPYRTHWWRNQLVRNHVDSWVYGRYKTPGSMSGDDPTPPYESWQSLCAANIQDVFKLGGGPDGPAAADAVIAGTMPGTGEFDAVADLLVETARDTFARLGPGRPQIPLPDLLKTADAFKKSYVGALAVLWFMTSGPPFCADPPGPPPAGAENPPPWFPSGSGSGGGGSAPPNPYTPPSTADTVSAIILAILFWPVTVIALIAGGTDALDDIFYAIGLGGSIDWVQLRGTVHWLQVLMFTAEDSLQDALVKAGLGYPPARKLGTHPADGMGLTTIPVTDTSNTPLTKSHTRYEYPLRMFSPPNPKDPTKTLPPDSGFDRFPTSALEAPATQLVIPEGAYADAVIDPPLAHGGIDGDDGTQPSRYVDFGGAVDNAVAVITSEAATLVNYNLDGDRGYGWKTWYPKLGTNPSNPSQPVQSEMLP